MGLIYRDGSFLDSSLVAFLVLTLLPIKRRTSQPHVKEGKEDLTCTDRSLENAILFPSPPSRSGLQDHATNPTVQSVCSVREIRPDLKTLRLWEAGEFI